VLGHGPASLREAEPMRLIRRTPEMEVESISGVVRANGSPKEFY
jgi:hypothetical protein